MTTLTPNAYYLTPILTITSKEMESIPNLAALQVGILQFLQFGLAASRIWNARLDKNRGINYMLTHK